MELTGKVIFITGATGCVGNHLLDRLLDFDCKEIRCLVRNKGFLSSSDERVVIIHGDLSSEDVINQALSNVDIVINCAAQVHSYNSSEEDFIQINVTQTDNLMKLSMANNISRFILISTVATYEDSSIVSESSKRIPASIYGKSKLAAEEIALGYFSDFGFPVSIVQLGTLFGKYDRGNFGGLIKIIKKRIFPILGFGKNVKSFTYVKDAVNGIVSTILTDKTLGERFIISDSLEVSFVNLIRQVSNEINTKLYIIRIPYKVSFFVLLLIDKFFKRNLSYKAKALIKETKYDASYSKELIGDYIEFGFVDGFRDCKQWYLGNVR
ncbi:NAD(P)-dependent oxidoreductase [Paenibacillus sp. G2S3]|uniref:NAD-dependent epimerase/dehydratase family protein n=1 Tax=Paenibacillus sp. G2S3 TaxID=3047872 RepID=UPI0024C0F6D0|nr:NAD(P)-dependent oxidoreductase [Paenibacillus sp. G2S3]WHY18433.1 NAD(P)-dependent oxidoreductase [Paenibacillus sp. G2S3]